MALLDKNQIDNIEDASVKIIDVPEWGEDAQVGIRVLTGRERDQFEDWVMRTTKGGGSAPDLRARFCALVICDAQGKRLFEDKISDKDLLSKKSSKALDRIMKAARTWNGVDDTDLAVAAGNSTSEPD